MPSSLRIFRVSNQGSSFLFSRRSLLICSPCLPGPLLVLLVHFVLILLPLFVPLCLFFYLFLSLFLPFFVKPSLHGIMVKFFFESKHQVKGDIKPVLSSFLSFSFLLFDSLFFINSFASFHFFLSFFLSFCWLIGNDQSIRRTKDRMQR